MKRKTRPRPGQASLLKQALSRFECRQCGTCCQGEGGIYLSSQEIARISRFLKTTPQNFLQAFCLEKNGKIYIHTQKDGFCHFSREGKCTIHPVKPGPCRKWPFFDPMLRDQFNWEVARQACPAISPYLTLKDYLAGRSLEDLGTEDR